MINYVVISVILLYLYYYKYFKYYFIKTVTMQPVHIHSGVRANRRTDQVEMS